MFPIVIYSIEETWRMAMRINTYNQSIESEVMNIDFINFFIPFLPQIEKEGDNRVRLPSIHDVQLYNGDLSGYLTSIGMDVSYHYIVMLFNKMTRFTDFNHTTDKIIIPDTDMVDRVASLYNSKRKTV